MESEFDEVIDRRGTNSEKWAAPWLRNKDRTGPNSSIQMWVADMDFRAPQAVLDALGEAVHHGVFGYTFPSQNFVDSVIEWQRARHRWDPDPKWLIHTSGVVSAIYQAVRAFSDEGDAVLIQPPVYKRFYAAPTANHRRIVEAPLHEGGGVYSFDAPAFEKVIKESSPKIFILCHPHNPVGKVWTEEELRQMGEICYAHHVLVISDEIHQDFVFGTGRRHIPFASLGAKFEQNCLVCTSPTKTFNIAGLQNSNIFIPNKMLRDRFSRELDQNGNHDVNSLGMVACEAAYRNGGEWLDRLLKYIHQNHQVLAGRLGHIPGLRAIPSDALYLAWLDCRQLGMKEADLDEFLQSEARVHLERGTVFGAGGDGFMRINLGCPRATLESALDRIQNALSK